MKLVQPRPRYSSPLHVPADARVKCTVPLRFVKYRYAHHAAPSGYSRICDYIDAPCVELSNATYWLGETLVRPLTKLISRSSRNIEYSRYDCTIEMQLLADAMLREKGLIYHFIYAEKQFSLSGRFASQLKRRGHRLVGTVHHMPEQQKWLCKHREGLKQLDHVITMDERSIGYWQEITGRPNVQWVPNGVDVDYFTPVEKSTERNHRVLFAGSHERDLPTLARTIELLNATDQFEFELVGKSHEVAALANRFSNVTQHMRLSDEDYRSLIQRCSVLLLPLHCSTFCNVVLEAMACGVPVVTTQGGIEAYLNDECAVVVAPKDAAGLAEGVRRLCFDTSGASSTARRQAENYSWRKVAERHNEVYEQAYNN